MPRPDHYRKHSKGLVTVYGNSAEIKETPFNLSPSQRLALAKEEFTDKRIAVNEQDEKEFQEYVIANGLQYTHRPIRQVKEKPKAPKRKRGDITCFTRKSRYRLLKKYNRVNPDREVKPYHIVLTYPRRFPTDGKEYKADLDVFFKRVKTKFGRIEYLWKLEFQGRGAPHYHIILYLSKNYRITFLREWMINNWYEVAQRFWDTKIDNHLEAGTSCDLVDSHKKASFYLSKYIAKQEEDVIDWETGEIIKEASNYPENQGRFWGCSRNWGDVILKEQHLTAHQLILLRRLIKRLLKDQERMSKLVTRPINLVIFGHWSFFVQAIKWVRSVH